MKGKQPDCPLFLSNSFPSDQTTVMSLSQAAHPSGVTSHYRVGPTATAACCAIRQWCVWR
jgi:hypothetical protein